METVQFKETVKEAILFSVSFFLFAVVSKIYSGTEFSLILKTTAICGYILGLFYFFTYEQLVKFSGFAFMMFCYNYIIQEESIDIVVKVLGSVVVLVQIGTLGEMKQRKNIKT